jgi:exosome complex component RRP4
MRIVLPGDKISDGVVRMENAVIEDGKTYATVMGLMDEEKGAFIPLESVWYPREGDFVIGIIENSKNRVSTVMLNSPFRGLILPPRPSFGRDRGGRGGGYGRGREEPQENLEVGDIVSAFVREVKRESDQIIMILERPKKLFGGKMVTVRPSKVPRIIGRANTMLRQLETGTKSTILVGLNGVVWLKGGNVTLALKAIAKIQEEAHVGGLTERITKLLAAGGS